MATATYFFPGALYPGSYKPPVGTLAFNPPLASLLDGLPKLVALASGATAWSAQLPNGLVLKLAGSGFTYDSHGKATGGKAGTLQILQHDGTTPVQSVTGLSLDFAEISSRLHSQGGDAFAQWIFGGNDTLVGTDGDDVLYGYGGDDILNGGDRDDVFVGGRGADTYNGAGGDDQISFVDAKDDPTAHGIDLHAAERKLIDPWGNTEYFSNIQWFVGTLHADRMVGSDADEVFTGLGGDDIIDGGGGIDTIRFADGTTYGTLHGVNVDLSTGIVTDEFGASDRVSGIENVKATDAADTLVGDVGANLFIGRDGNDRLTGGGGNDVLFGGNGKDRLSGGSGKDRLSGGSGDDSLYGGSASDKLKGEGGNDRLAGGSGNDWLSGGGGSDRLDGGSGSDTLKGGRHSDRLTGGTGNDRLEGNSGNDVLSGGSGRDRLQGGSGVDRLQGGTGNDRLEGGSGDDRLSGGAGADKLFGGKGHDAFVFQHLSDSTARASGRDTIGDFSKADHFDLRLLDADRHASGNQSFTFIGTHHFHGVAGELRFEKHKSDTYIYADTNGDKKADFGIHLDDAVSLTKAMFLL